jgi:hypothetical protein
MTTYSDYFVTGTRDDGTSFVSLRDDRPDWLQQAVYDAHDDEMPNDWRYAMCERIVSAIDDGVTGVDELVDSLVDTWTADRLAWLSDNIGRVSYVDDAIDDGLVDCSAGLVAMIGVGQYVTISQMVDVIVSAIDDAEHDPTGDVDDEDDEVTS